MAARRPKRSAPSSEKVYAVVIFSDIRGFSQWSSNIDAHESTFQLVSAYQKILREEFGYYAPKALGDGAMLIKEAELTTIIDINDELSAIIDSINRTEARFKELLEAIAIRPGSKVLLDLGWGVTRGTVIKIVDGSAKDYLGHIVNESARLCDIARPCGIVIDKDDFPAPPGNYRTWFREQTRKLSKPGQDVSVWVSSEIYEQFQAREYLKETPEVNVAGVCARLLDGNWKILLAQRSGARKLFPLKWESCGGQLRNSETFQDGVKRHFQTEMKVSVSVFDTIQPELYSITGPSLIPGLRFACLYLEGEPSSPNHIQTAWKSLQELKNMNEEDFPPGFQTQAISLVSKIH